jgi:hypothetical protein
MFDDGTTEIYNCLTLPWIENEPKKLFNHILRLELLQNPGGETLIDKFIHFERSKQRSKPYIDNYLLKQEDSLSLILPMLKSAKDKFKSDLSLCMEKIPMAH